MKSMKRESQRKVEGVKARLRRRIKSIIHLSRSNGSSDDRELSFREVEVEILQREERRVLVEFLGRGVGERRIFESNRGLSDGGRESEVRVLCRLWLGEEVLHSLAADMSCQDVGNHVRQSFERRPKRIEGKGRGEERNGREDRSQLRRVVSFRPFVPPR